MPADVVVVVVACGLLSLGGFGVILAVVDI